LVSEDKAAKEEGLWLEGQRTILSYLRTVVLKKKPKYKNVWPQLDAADEIASNSAEKTEQ